MSARRHRHVPGGADRVDLRAASNLAEPMIAKEATSV
jgi:hypothetical protein